MKQTLINDFLGQKTIALAGVSRSGKGFGNIVMSTLSKKGYQILPVHHEVKEIKGVACYSSLSSLPADIENLVLVIPPERTEKIVVEIPSSGIKRVWMQQGSQSEKAIKLCEDNQIDLVHSECILMFAEPQGLHKFHHWLRGVFGQKPN